MRNILPFLVSLALTLTLSGCAGSVSDESLYHLPKLPADYETLETLIDALLAEGAEYAAPASGSNLQSVQMVDLDGDGEEEAIACFRRSGDEKPMKIYVFRTVDGIYEQYSVIEGTSSSIYSISYADLNGDGWRELLVGVRGDLDVQNLAVYSLSDTRTRQFLVTGYSRYAVLDMSGDGRQELIVLRSDEESFNVADYYVWDGDALELRSTLRLSSTVVELHRLTAGTLYGGQNALFVSAVTEENAMLLDVLAVRDGKLQNISPGEALRFAGLYPTDVDGDGITEIPDPVPFPLNNPEGQVYYRIRWRRCYLNGSSNVVRETYQNTQDGWSLIIPEDWHDRVTVERVSGVDGSSVTFSVTDGVSMHPFLTVYSFTGYNRMTLATRNGRIALSRQAEAVYAAELTEYAAGLIDESALRERFSLIAAEWSTGEN